MNTYITFLILKTDLSEFCNALHTVDLTAQKLLEKIAIRHELDQPLKVGEAIAFRELGSISSLHRKLNELMQAGLIEMKFKGKDRRTKYLVPTKIANDFFEVMGHALIAVMKNNLQFQVPPPFTSMPLNTLSK